MNLTKKILAVIGATGLIGGSAAIIAVSAPKKASLTVLLVPSKDVGELNKTTARLGHLIQDQLATYGFNETVKVKVAQSYDIAASSVVYGTAAIGYLPTLNYYQSSIRTNNNKMHQLFQTTRTALRVEYELTDSSLSQEERLDEMNRNGRFSTIKDDEKNIYSIVKNLGPLTEHKDIATYLDEGIAATYYRGYQYITKKTLNEFYNQALKDNSSAAVKDAWTTIIEPIENNKAIFNSKVAPTQENIDKYWRVAWDIFERAAKTGKLALSNQKTSAAGRVNPIATMMETWIKVNKKDETSKEDLQQAQQAVINLLTKKGHFTELPNYAAETLPQLIDGRIQTGIAFADVRTQIRDDIAPYPTKKVLDEVSVFASSHGAINDGAVYSTRYFRNKDKLLQAVQNTFIDLIRHNKEAQKIFDENYSHKDYMPSKIFDKEAMAEYEEQIRISQESNIIKMAQEISNAIKPK